MPIMFEEMSGEVVPERAPEPREPAQPQAEDAVAQLHRELTLMHEREQRLLAD